jgi:NAD kinase
MNWLSLDSSVLAAAAYVSSERTLYLRFNSGEIYRYFDVPPEHYHKLLEADSQGRHFSYEIRDRFRCERLTRTDAAAG